MFVPLLHKERGEEEEDEASPSSAAEQAAAGEVFLCLVGESTPPTSFSSLGCEGNGRDWEEDEDRHLRVTEDDEDGEAPRSLDAMRAEETSSESSALSDRRGRRSALRG